MGTCPPELANRLRGEGDTAGVPKALEHAADESQAGSPDEAKPAPPGAMDFSPIAIPLLAVAGTPTPRVSSPRWHGPPRH